MLQDIAYCPTYWIVDSVHGAGTDGNENRLYLWGCIRSKSGSG